MTDITSKDLLLLILKEKLLEDKAFLLAACCVPTVREGKYSHCLKLVDKKLVLEYKDTKYVCTDHDVSLPFIYKNRPVKLEPMDLINVTTSVDTTYPLAMFNSMLLCDILGDKVPYHNAKFGRRFINPIITENQDAPWMCVDIVKRVQRVCDYLSCLSELVVYETDPDLVGPSKEALAVRDRLVKQYKDQLDDPMIVSMIDNEIVKVLAKEVANSKAADHYSSAKQINKVRKMTHGMAGGFERLDDETKVATVTASLIEGWGPEHMVAIANQIRIGSYDRGKNTALGGDAANVIARITQNIKVTDNDCGTKAGLLCKITKENMSTYIGHYKTDGKLLDLDTLKSLVGQSIYIRLPLFCNETHGNTCKKCVGERVANNRMGIGPQITENKQVFLALFLASFHGKTLSTVKVDLKECIS